MSPSSSKKRKSGDDSSENHKESSFHPNSGNSNSQGNSYGSSSSTSKRNKKTRSRKKQHLSSSVTSQGSGSNNHGSSSSKKSSSGGTCSSPPPLYRGHGNHQIGGSSSPSQSQSATLSTSTPLDLILTGDKRRGLYECDFCRRDISQIPRIRCAICPDFDSCLDCFATTDPSALSSLSRNGQKIVDDDSQSNETLEETVSNNSTSQTPKVGGLQQHTSSHGYRVADSTRFPVFPSRSMDQWSGGKVLDDLKNMWTVEEDLRLLDAVQTWGLGNWTDVSEAVGNNKSARRCMERYCDDYLGRYGFILPKYTLIELDEDHVPSGDENNPNPNPNPNPNSNPNSEKDADKDDNSVTSVSTTWSIPSTSSNKRCKTTKKKRNERLSNAAATALMDQIPSIQPKPKRYAWVLTETLPGYKDVWPEPYVPPIPSAALGKDVGRDVTFRAEQTFNKALAAATTKSAADDLTKEWRTKSSDPNEAAFGARVLPPRLEDVRALKGSELAGYMPRREDFDVEWENDAETILADMEFSPNDPPNEKKLKLEIIEIYNQKLDERERRKKFLQDWNLLDYRMNQIKDKSRPKDERELIQRMRLFARFHSKDDHDKFIQNLLEAKRLRKEIAKLQHYKTIGITSLSQMETYQLDQKRRESHKIEYHKKSKEEEKAMIEFERYAKESSATAFPVIPKQDRKNRKSINRGLSTGSSDTATATTRADNNLKDHQSSDQTNNNDANPPHSSANDSFDISQSDGYELLTPKEMELCKSLQLLPRHYIDAKKALIQKSLEVGILAKDDWSRTIVQIDVSKRKDVVDFVVRSGWISASLTKKKKEPVPKE